jgi:hypothetical protein
MTSKRVLRYYCDHCRKGGCSKHHMEKHERRCIRNPNRQCGFCEVEKLTPIAMPELISALDSGGLQALKEAAHNCPACILAAIVQSKVKDGDDYYVEFDYKEEVKAFWADRNDVDYPPADYL